MSFFIKPNSSSNKGNKKQKAKLKRKLPRKVKSSNEEISSDEDDLGENNKEAENAMSDDEYETTQEKKIRLAKTYLKQIEEEEKRRLEENADDDTTLNSGDIVSKRLKEDYLKQTGKYKTFVADKYTGADLENISVLKCRDHKRSVTCLCVSSNDTYVYSGSKDGGIVKWSLQEKMRLSSVPHVKQNHEKVKGHSRIILGIALSSDDQFLAVADESKDVQIWNPEDLQHVNTLKGHLNAVTGVTFKRNSHVLYSCSKDRSVRVWSLDEMAFVETLFGHQNAIMSIDALAKERALTAGGMDKTIRVWKITEESQLIFNGSGNIDTVCFINDDHFMSGGDDGQLCIWSVAKKKPLCTVKEAHGINQQNQQPHWITAVASLRNTDLVASGSNCGNIKLWKTAESFRSIALCFNIPVCGFVNSLVFTSLGDQLIAAIGQEYKFGRWDVIKQAKNSVVVIPLLRQ